MKTRVSLKYPVNDCLWKHFFVSNLPQTPLNLISLNILVTLKGLSHSFNLKLEQSSGKNVLKFALLGKCFFDLFNEVEIWY